MKKYYTGKLVTTTNVPNYIEKNEELNIEACMDVIFYQEGTEPIYREVVTDLVLPRVIAFENQYTKKYGMLYLWYYPKAENLKTFIFNDKTSNLLKEHGNLNLEGYKEIDEKEIYKYITSHQDIEGWKSILSGMLEENKTTEKGYQKIKKFRNKLSVNFFVGKVVVMIVIYQLLFF